MSVIDSWDELTFDFDMLDLTKSYPLPISQKIVTINNLPPITSVFTCNGLYQMKLNELVYHRLLWRKYIKYLEILRNQKVTYVLLPGLDKNYPITTRRVMDLMWLAVGEHNQLDHEIENIIYKNEPSITKKHCVKNGIIEEEQEKGSKELTKELCLIPPSFRLFCNAIEQQAKDSDYEYILEKAIEQRQLWMGYTKYYLDARPHSIKVKDIISERKKFEEFICALLEVIYCYESDKQIKKEYNKSNKSVFLRTIKYLFPCYELV